MDEIISSILYGSGLISLLCLAALAGKFLTKKIDAVRIDERVREKELARLGLDIAEKAIKTVAEASVGKLEEIIAKDLREKVKSGEADQSELCALAGEAYYEVIQTIQPEVLQTLSDSLQDVELYIRNQIEHQLRLLKAKLNGGASDEKAE